MNLLHIEKYPGLNQNIYEIKIIDYHNIIEVSIFLILSEVSGRSLAWRYLGDVPFDLKNEIVKAKAMISTASFIDRALEI